MGLANHLIVKNASMSFGDPTRLTGTLKDPRRPDAAALEFRERLHAGMRITVAGAGPAGSTLVSDVVEVVNTTTIILADATSAAVSSVEVILNDPDLVALSNYARRDVSDLTVDLGDRSVGDAAMRIGGRGLQSATARFSSLDLDKQVAIQAAGLLVTAIQSIGGPTQATLTTPAQRAVESVQADVWKTDSRPGLELLLEAAQPARRVRRDRVRTGRLRLHALPNLADFDECRHRAAGCEHLTLRGSGAGATILRLTPNQDLSKPDTHVIETVDCRNLTLRDLSVHGAYLTMGNTNEQIHGININQDSEDIVVEHVRVFQSAGDGIRLLGRSEDTEDGIPANKVRRSGWRDAGSSRTSGPVWRSSGRSSWCGSATAISRCPRRALMPAWTLSPPIARHRPTSSSSPTSWSTTRPRSPSRSPASVAPTGPAGSTSPTIFCSAGSSSAPTWTS